MFAGVAGVLSWGMELSLLSAVKGGGVSQWLAFEV